MGSLSWDRVTVIIIRCSRQLMQEIGWGFLGKPDRREKQEILDPCRGHYMIYRDLKAKSYMEWIYMLCQRPELYSSAVLFHNFTHNGVFSGRVD